MCYAASFVLTQENEYWSLKSDNHENIIRENNLRDGEMVSIVRVEISPKNGDYSIDPKEWVFKVDQDLLPLWAEDRERLEKRARKALNQWLKSKLVTKGTKEVKEGMVYVVGKATVALCGNASAKLYDNASAKLYGNASATLYDSASATLYGNASATLYDSASATLYDNASAKLYDNASAKLCGNASATLYDSASATLYDSASATLYDNAFAVRGHKITCASSEYVLEIATEAKP